MAKKPEFIGLLRDIRDRLFPSMVTMHSEVETKYDTVVTLAQELSTVTVDSPVEVVPIQENGDVGLPDVQYDSNTGTFYFSIPAGSKGEDLGIDYTVALTNDLYSLVVEDGEIAFSNEDSKVYVKLFTGTNINSSDWSTGTLITPTTSFQDMTDTPSSMIGSEGYFLAVNANGDSIVYLDYISLLAVKANLTGATFTGQVKGITPVSIEDLTRKDYVDTKMPKSGGTFTGQAKGITPVNAEDLTRKDYVDTKAPKDSPAFINSATLDGENILTDSAKSISVNGYQKLGNGLIMQWGTIIVDYDQSNTDGTFPITFPTACLNITANRSVHTGSVSGTQNAYIEPLNASTFRIIGEYDTASTLNVPTYWFAIGH